MPQIGLPFPNIDPIIFQIGPLAIRWYALAYITGLLLGWWYARRLVANAALWTVPPGKPEMLEDLLVWVTLGVVIGGRLGMLLYEPGYYLANPLELVKIWDGGMAFHGGLIGATLAAIIFARRNGLVVLSILDILAVTAPIGLFFGRVANFINGELWGRVTEVPWGFIFPHSDGQLRHPSQLYEAALEGIVLFLVLFVATRMGALKRPGLCTGLFAVGYWAARSLAEIYREPDALLIGPVTIGQAYSLPMLLIGAGLIVYALRRQPEVRAS